MNMIIFTGIQGSGKTTFYKEHFLYTHLRISLDMLKTRNREWKLIETCLATGTAVVIDNTNVLIADRARYISAARQNGFKVRGYFFDIDLKEALERNRHREGILRVPDGAIYATVRKLQVPSIDEGFDELIRI